MSDIDYAAVDFSRWSPGQRLWQAAAALLMKSIARVHIEGIEKIPSSGAFVAATNHVHILDVPLYFSMAPRRTICFVSDNWQNTPLLSETNTGRLQRLRRSKPACWLPGNSWRA